MILFPPAKINLGLLVKEKRSDGYHEIASCMYPIPVTDIIEILEANTLEFHQSGLLVDGNPENNLCLRAYHLLQEKYQLPPVYMHLRKQIPMGAGLGGGSSDAAYVIRGLNTIFGLSLSDQQMEDFSAQLGSDCPFFINEVPQIARGRGELLTPIDLSLKDYYLQVIHPGIHVGTAEAYSGVHFSQENPGLESILKGEIKDWQNNLRNDFEVSIFAKYPEIGSIKETLYKNGAIYASMSGSGSALFGIFEDKPKEIEANYFQRIVRL